jgi:hypothetical protein
LTTPLLYFLWEHSHTSLQYDMGVYANKGSIAVRSRTTEDEGEQAVIIQLHEQLVPLAHRYETCGSQAPDGVWIASRGPMSVGRFTKSGNSGAQQGKWKDTTR